MSDKACFVWKVSYSVRQPEKIPGPEVTGGIILRRVSPRDLSDG